MLGEHTRDQSIARVLVADDDPLLRQLFARSSARSEFEILTVDDGQAALAAVSAQPAAYACVVLDIVMPVMDGVTAAEQIARIAPLLPIVLMSGAIPTEMLERFDRLALAAFLTKPFTVAQFRSTIKEIIARSGAGGASSAELPDDSPFLLPREPA